MSRFNVNANGQGRGVFKSPPPPATRLGWHRQLSSRAGVQVSPICMGGMNIGDKWQSIGMGYMDKEMSFKLLDTFYEAGGNFIDTASNYQDEASEQFIGEWMEERGLRDQIVLATKYTSAFKRADNSIKQKSHYTGNNLKAMHISVEGSLKKLRTDYIDILYVHWWDWNSSVEEVMDGLHQLVLSGKVLYLGVSDTPAWIVAQANTYARMAHKSPFVVYQGAWSILQRDFERDIIPMARSHGLALAPWGVLAGGKIRSDADERRRQETGEKGRQVMSDDWERTAEEKKICDALEIVAKEVGAKSLTSVAIAYIMQKTDHVFPIIGGRKVEQLMDNIDALNIALSAEQIKYLEDQVPFDPGFPNNICGDGSKYGLSFSSAGNFEKWPLPEAIRPTKQ